MNFLQLKQAETAIKDGRLDEASRILGQASVRDYARGQQLIGRLARAYAERARIHLANGLPQQAYADCGLAEKLAGAQPDIASLKGEINQTIIKQQADRAQQAAVLAQAQNHLRNGQLSVCEDLLAEADGGQGKALLQQAAVQRQQQQALARRLEAGLRQGHIQTALAALEGVHWREFMNRDDELADLIARVRIDFCGRVRQALQAGRVDQAQMLAEQGEAVAGDMIDYQELRRIMVKLGQARCAVERCQAQQAARILKQIRPALADAAWLDTAILHADRAAEAVDALQNGPLGLIITGQSQAGLNLPDEEAERIDTIQDQAALPLTVQPETGEPPLPDRFVLHVDGVGSYLVFTGSRVTVGPVSSARRPDLGLLADASGAVATFERFEDDYLLVSDQPVQVNQKSVQKSILCDNDRIDLSYRLSLRFRKPNPASGTALLDLASARLPAGDIRYAALLRRELVFGPGSAAHVRDDNWSQQAVLTLRDGRLYCDSRTVATVRGQALGRGLPLPMAQPLRLGEVSLVITPYGNA